MNNEYVLFVINQVFEVNCNGHKNMKKTTIFN